MSVEKHIVAIAGKLRAGAFTSEAAVSQGIVLPTLNALGWPVFDTAIVTPEYSVGGRRVDYALCHPENRPSVFIEVKKVGLSEGADKQLFEYAFHRGVPMAILTDGQEWNFYLPGEQGRYDERRVYKLDILERSEQESSERLTRYLRYEDVCSGAALDLARTDYRNISQNRTVQRNIPKAWQLLLKEQDSLLLELLADKVEDLCGYQPTLDDCAKFISGISNDSKVVSAPSVPVPPRGKRQGSPKRTPVAPSGDFFFEINGKKEQATSAREVMTLAFQYFNIKDDSFFERFAARKHGKKRRYLSNDKYELYPGRPDLVELHSIEVADGWWLGTNYSRRDISKIISLAIEVYSVHKSDSVNFAV